jgi:endonuclease/exonuclease/phosphatase family metal-dependent hydrolase
VTTELRVLTYNVRALRDDAAAVSRIIRECDPDVVCVQEAPRLLRWRSRCARLARESGLLYVGGGGTTGGAALLVSMRVDVDDVHEVLLSRRPRLHRRGVTRATLHRAGGPDLVTVASVHLGLDADERQAHAREVVALLDDAPGPVVVAGDLNERPGRPAWTVLAEGGLSDLGPGNGPTFPAVLPEKRIDAVLGGSDVEVLEHRVVQTTETARASDHLPVLAVLRVGRPVAGPRPAQ